MTRAYPPEFRARAVALVRAGKQAKQTAAELGIHPVTMSKRVRKDDVDRSRWPGTSSLEFVELRAVRRHIYFPRPVRPTPAMRI